jgi:hypothetical protein
MPDYAAYFLSSPASAIQLELFEISHPDFTQTYRKVRNATAGVTVTLETEEVEFFGYFPLRIRPTSSSDDLDQMLKIDMGDLGEVLPTELDAITDAGGMGVKPIVRFRVYRSDDLSAPLFGPLLLEVQTFSFAREGATFEAKAPSLNINRTGEIYRLDRFPMLRGLL